MYPRSSRLAPRAGVCIALVAVAIVGLAPVYAEQIDLGHKSVQGRVDFRAADLPPATVEIDLNREIFGDLFGLGDAAVAGVLQSLTESNQSESSQVTELAAERLADARELIGLVKDVVTEVRVRVYEDLPDEEKDLARRTAASFDKQLQEGNWDKVLTVRERGESVRVALLRVEGAVSGVFISATDGDDLVLVNVVCDASPENVKKLTAAATKIGLENGLRDVLEKELRHLVH